ncbi:hypothetical protein BC829DRAFT_488869 [Chytridium lagenaria]|nr:hypothetical protein BC829DRAFT_488869 [Chytridium lagenaria]
MFVALKKPNGFIKMTTPRLCVLCILVVDDQHDRTSLSEIPIKFHHLTPPPQSDITQCPPPPPTPPPTPHSHRNSCVSSSPTSQPTTTSSLSPKPPVPGVASANRLLYTTLQPKSGADLVALAAGLRRCRQYLTPTLESPLIHVRTLDLSHLKGFKSKVTDQMFRNMMDALCPPVWGVDTPRSWLQCVNVSDCFQLTNESLWGVLWRHGRSLERLDVSFCNLVTIHPDYRPEGEVEAVTFRRLWPTVMLREVGVTIGGESSGVCTWAMAKLFAACSGRGEDGGGEREVGNLTHSAQQVDDVSALTRSLSQDNSSVALTCSPRQGNDSKALTRLRSTPQVNDTNTFDVDALTRSPSQGTDSTALACPRSPGQANDTKDLTRLRSTRQVNDINILTRPSRQKEQSALATHSLEDVIHISTHSQPHSTPTTQSITSLTLSIMSESNPWPSIFSHPLLSSTPHQTSLQNLSISQCRLTDPTLHLLLTHLLPPPTLQTLTILNERKLSSPSLLSFITHTPFLRSLDLRGCSRLLLSDTLHILTLTGKTLTTLALGPKYTSQEIHASLIAMLTILKTLTSHSQPCPNLTSLHLSADSIIVDTNLLQTTSEATIPLLNAINSTIALLITPPTSLTHLAIIITGLTPFQNPPQPSLTSLLSSPSPSTFIPLKSLTLNTISSWFPLNPTPLLPFPNLTHLTLHAFDEQQIPHLHHLIPNLPSITHLTLIVTAYGQASVFQLYQALDTVSGFCYADMEVAAWQWVLGNARGDRVGVRIVSGYEGGALKDGDWGGV